ncbi:MAG TPA: SpoIIE family protein phosphatase [Desulfuromonadales bacterium]|nr:SpoIIE family protein phosphatase [Desulfuromonadales bacterium]
MMHRNTVELNQGDILLLCSDGLTDMLTDKDIETVLTNNATTLDGLAANLIGAANANGGLDNISVVLVKFQNIGEKGATNQNTEHVSCGG